MITNGEEANVMKRWLYVAFAAGLALAAPVRCFAQADDPPAIDEALMSVASPGGAMAGQHEGATTTVTAAEHEAGETGEEGPEVEGVEGPEDPNDTGPNVDHQFEGEETGENGNGAETAGGPGH
jgi:hypothetical protein